MHFKQYKAILLPHNGMNVYRGCTHGCIYCDSRSRCYRMEHDFEDVEVKQNAPEMLEAALRAKRKKCMIGTGAMTDPYLPLEMELRYTRRCLEVIDRYGFGLAIQTKSDRILRDLDLLKSIHARAKCVVQITLTTTDEALCRLIEPNVCTTAARVEVLNTLRDHGIPTVVWLSPFLPFLNDTRENLAALLDRCVKAKVRGILCFGIGMTLREGDREYYYQKLDEHFPGLKQRYIEKFGLSYICNSDNHEELMALFRSTCAQTGIMSDAEQIFAYLHAFPERPAAEQLSFFS